MKLVFSQRALREIERCGRWWIEHRNARELFAEELTDAFDRIRREPTLGPVYRVTGGREQRRVLMPRTAHHVYYRITGDELVVLAVWGARRGRAPER